MSSPPNQAAGEPRPQRPLGHPRRYSEMDDGDEPDFQPRNQSHWGWSSASSNIEPSQAMSHQFVGPPYPYPYYPIGYGSSATLPPLQGGGSPVSSLHVGPFYPTIVPYSQSATITTFGADGRRLERQRHLPAYSQTRPGDSPLETAAHLPKGAHESSPISAAIDKDRAVNGKEVSVLEPRGDVNTLEETKRWVDTLVGYDWEIFWSDDDNNSKQESKPAVPSPDNNDDESNSLGSIITDWYDGRILSAEIQRDGTVRGRAVFLGDDTVYEMELFPNKVRPSARVWIKRTAGILFEKDEDAPDTPCPRKELCLDTFEDECRGYEPLGLPSKPGIVNPAIEQLHKIVALKMKLKTQIDARLKLAPIVNLHGSMKYVGGELNPTESLVNYLVECCNELILACEWYLRCWELLYTFFGPKRRLPSNKAETRQEGSMKYTLILDDYLELGKICIVNCASVSIESNATKRRQLFAPPGQRRTKRRKKQQRWGDKIDLGAPGDEDYGSSFSVDPFPKFLNLQTRWYLPLLATMFRALSHHIVDPLVDWVYKVNQLLGWNDDHVVSLFEEREEDSAQSRQSNQDESQSDEELSAASFDSIERLFSFQDLEQCIHAVKDHRVLSRLDLLEAEQALRAKGEVVARLSKEASSLMDRIGEDCSTSSESSSSDRGDAIFHGLQWITKQLESPENSAHNIDPLGFAEVEVSRQRIEVAILWREFFLDVWNLSILRERKQFIQDLVSRKAEMPDPVGLSLGGLRARTEQQLHDKVTALQSVAGVEFKYEEMMINTGINAGLMSKSGLELALEELRSLPVLLFVEEKLSLRLSYLHWIERASESLPRNDAPVPFALLESLYNQLDRIMKGKTTERSRMTLNLKTNEKMENAIKAFINNDANIIDPTRIHRVVELYRVSSQWKERAEAVISALRMHGNSAAGEVIQTTKLPCLVDLRRVSDLISEYDRIEVDIPYFTSVLQGVLDNARHWSSRLETELLRAQSVDETARILADASHVRPKGVIMDPTRHVLEMLSEMVFWHYRAKQSWEVIMTLLQAHDAASCADVVQEQIQKQVYPLLAEGLDIVDTYAKNYVGQHRFSVDRTTKIFETLNIRRSAKHLSREKILGHSYGELLLGRIVNKELDQIEGSPVALFLWADWHLAITAFVSSVGAPSEGSTVSTLRQALDLRSDEPGQTAEDKSLVLDQFLAYQSTEKALLGNLIKEAEEDEIAALTLLTQSRELRKGCIEKSEPIRGHLAALKDSLFIFSERRAGRHGLAIDSLLDSQLEHHVKIFTWLVKILPYRFLFLDEASYATFSQQDERMPWDALVSLFERLPTGDESTIDDFALVSMRVRELYQMARKWQDNITRSTLLSNRGGKRRNQSQSPIKEQDQEVSSNLQMEKIQQLVDDPILLKVVMPREVAVKTILQKSQEFEMKLHAFLRKDFDVKTADRTPYPSTRSLVGRKGEFVLFRLTGSDLFESVLQTMDELSAIAENVFAETPEKITFEWIQQGVGWIDELNDAVTSDSPFGNRGNRCFTVPEEKCRELLGRGGQIFSEIPRDLKSTLSQHGIFVSTSKIDQTVKVVLKKDGAHHSVGGTVIRWCPILLKCLRSDASRLDEWQQELTLLTKECFELQADPQRASSDDEKSMYDRYCFRERATYLWNEGARSLVVAPRIGLVTSFNHLFNKMNECYERNTNPDFDRKFSRMRFLDGMPVIEQRFVLTESLLYRQFLDMSRDKVRLPTDGQKTFRDTCRSILMECLTKAVKIVGMHHFSNTFTIDELEGYCCLRTWEIENEMFDRFQDSLGLTRPSPEYIAKGRNLKATLNENNLSMSLEVLLGEITAEKLVSMSSNDLANHSAKIALANTEDEARNSFLLDVAPETDSSQLVTRGATITRNPPNLSPSEKPPSILRTSRLPVSPVPLSSAFLPTYSSDEDASTGSPLGDLPVADERGDYPKSEETLDVRPLSFGAGLPPPPPPSLLNGFRIPGETREEEHGNRIKGSSGDDNFQFDMINFRIRFRAALYVEESKQSVVDRFLPETMTETGRAVEETFPNWIAEKAVSGKWAVVPLRIVPSSDEDGRQLTNLSESYERIHRIAMIKLTSETKLFVLTPNLQAVLARTRVVSFFNPRCPYAVLLSTDVRFG